MFRELARLGVSRAAAFFYAVAVGVVANVVIAHLSPHDTAAPSPSTSWPDAAKSKTPVATAIIAPRSSETKPAETKPVDTPHPIQASAPATSLPPVPTQGLSPSGPQTPSAHDAATILPAPAAMTTPPLQPAALPSAAPA
ncbi:MAG: hypothetical protein WAV02_02250, partial [Stellaceae bacterium]